MQIDTVVLWVHVFLIIHDCFFRHYKDIAQQNLPVAQVPAIVHKIDIHFHDDADKADFLRHDFQ